MFTLSSRHKENAIFFKMHIYRFILSFFFFTFIHKAYSEIQRTMQIILKNPYFNISKIDRHEAVIFESSIPM